jgi:hypothetical protein
MLLESCGRKIPQLFLFHPPLGIMAEIELLRRSTLMADFVLTRNALSGWQLSLTERLFF